MTLEPKVLTRESTDVNDVEQIGLSWLDGDSEILSIVQESILWDRFCASRVGFVEELGDQSCHLLVVPIRNREDNFLVHLVLIWKVGVVDDEGAAETIWVLSFIMGVIPVCS